jgi:hypothetical protein
MPLNFNDSDPQQGGTDALPAGVYKVRITLRPGGAGDGGLLKLAKNMSTEMLDLVFVVVSGAYAARRFFENWVVGVQDSDSMSDGMKTAVGITRARVRASLESAFGFSPDDESEQASKARIIETWAGLNGLEIVVRLGIRKQDSYPDKNVIQEIITPADKMWSTFMKNHPRMGGKGTVASQPLRNALDDEIPF